MQLSFNKGVPLLALLAASPLYARPLQSRNLPSLPGTILTNSGLQNASLSLSAGGNAVCVTGDVPVSITDAMGQNVLVDDLNNQTAVTGFMVEALQINSTIKERVNGGSVNVSGTFNINAKMCYPLTWNATDASSTIQILVHGIAFDKSYWDFTEGYSYIDAAAEAGYATFSYDRLGTGMSDHPDPIQTVQAPIQVEIAHSLIQSLRNGSFGGTSYDTVIGVGHSFGSIQLEGLTAEYPQDLNAVVLTGFTKSPTSMDLTFAAFNVEIARENQPTRFPELPNGYWLTDTSISNQLTFFRTPNFDVEILGMAEATKQTVTLGEYLTIGNVVRPATNFTGPVDVVDGENDFIFCQGNCYLPTDQAALVLKALYPAASNGSQSTILPGVGHGINLHYQAPDLFQQIITFVQANGF